MATFWSRVPVGSCADLLVGREALSNNSSWVFTGVSYTNQPPISCKPKGKI